MRWALFLLAASAAASDRLEVPLGLDAYIPAPADNPLTRAKVQLGRKLFFDKRLSLDRTISCATCHDPARAFTDGRPLAVGVAGRTADRRTPPLLNRAWGQSFFWDGRAGSLEQQALQPIANPKEMGLTVEGAVARLRREPEYEAAFQAAFGVAPDAASLSRALASYVRTILAGDSPYDRYVAGDPAALSAEARLGLQLFRGKANCAACHVGPNLTDERFHNTGAAWREGRWTDRGRAAVSGDESDLGGFKTPPLREVARTAPYMHNGSLASLEDVIDFYDRGGQRNPRLDPEMRPLHLSPAEKRAVAVFLLSLSGTVREGWGEP